MNILNRISVRASSIRIKNAGVFSKKSAELNGVMEFGTATPLINVIESNGIKRTYKIDPISGNSNLLGQFLHFSVRILENEAVMIDGVISKDKNKHLGADDKCFEAIRLQPFFLKKKRIRK